MLLFLLTVLCYGGKVAVCVYAWWGEPGHIALNFSLPSALLETSLPISPSPWTHALWLVLFVWELGFLLLCCFMLCRPRLPHLVCPLFYPAYSLACLLRVGWVFAFGRGLHPLALALVGVETLVLVACVSLLTGYLYFIRGTLKYYYPCWFWWTRLLVLNATVIYLTLSFVWSLFGLGWVLVSDAGLAEETASTILLSLLASCVVTYFLLENSILDRFLRYVFAPYPVFLWTLVGVLTGAWQGVETLRERNPLFALVLACVVGTLILLRIILWCIYMCVRPLPDYENDDVEELPHN